MTNSLTPTVETRREAFLATAADASAGARVPVELRVRVSDPFDAYRRARDEGGDGFFLETTGGQSGWGYFGIDPIERLCVGSDAETLGAADTGRGPNANTSPSLSTLDAALESESLVRGETGVEVPYPCGLFGWLSYDIARELESLPELADDDRNLPHLRLGLFDRVAAWEEPRGDEPATLHVTACPHVPAGADSTDDDRLNALYERAIERATDLAERAVSGDPSDEAAPVAGDEAHFESDCGRAAFRDRVSAVKRYIREGDTFQANISQRLVAPAVVHPVAAYRALRQVNPAPYSGLVEFPEADLVSASPELLVHVEGDRLVTEPIAGTRPRGATEAEDDALERDLTSDEKERAEHAMLVDLERNDLGKVSEYGSVEVSEYRRVDRYSEVMHLVSVVEGQRRPDVSVADAVAAVFPGGTITGAPKPRTMEIIEEVESTRRGPYTGSIAAFGFDDRATLNIVIRTLVHHDDEYHLRVGAGIVHDSDPDAEYDETMAKGRALVNAIDEALATEGHGMRVVERDDADNENERETDGRTDARTEDHK
ncbi:anthranilate synthase component I family protein [Halogeometricum borinquense]|uniref:anthranilate synthase n=1 Tax=Halogeometricum borinquense TaxID=60847 RepID=A0A6C0UDU1_9EURY|nr:anthranilate synthase component I family protein [Halogeometricum borinquense]QIB73340.1 anthranilate synthase component I family protein [Halogeometricum borinquense]QIQ77262.1 anthranilate synthase component I family protein [Halogeometricum borinquense]